MVAITVQPIAPTSGLRLVPRHRGTGSSGVTARLVMALLAVTSALLAIGFLTMSHPLDTAAVSAVPAVDGVHVVVEGETIWSIARDVAPAGEAATYVERLVAANGGATVEVGQRLRLPRS